MTVASKGTGRLDYSHNVENVTQPTIRSHQQRNAFTFELPDPATGSVAYSYDYPYVTLSAVAWPARDPNPLYFQKFYMQTDANKFIMLAVVSFLTWDDYLAGGPTDEFYAQATGYGNVEITFTKGLVYDAQRVIGILYNVICDNPYPSLPLGNWFDDYNLYCSIHAVEDTVVYGD